MTRTESHFVGLQRNFLGSQEGLSWRSLHYRHAKLESSACSSIILAAFGMDVMSSYAFTYPTHVPSVLMTLLSVNTVAMITMHCFAYVIGTWLSPFLHATTKEYHPSVDGPLEKVPAFSPHSRFSVCMKLCHQISHIFGLFIFLVEIVLIAWVKFWDVSLSACIASTVIMLPFMIGFVFFFWYFNFNYKTQIYKCRREEIENVELQYRQLSQKLGIDSGDVSGRGSNFIGSRILLRRKSTDLSNY